MGIECCIASVSSKESLYSSNLFSNKELKKSEKLLYLYNFIENQGHSISKYPKIVSNIKLICGNSCCNDLSEKETEQTGLVVVVKLSCEDNIIAESFVIY